MAVIDETGFLKKGTKSAGVKRQYRGTAGRIENCQMGIFLASASQIRPRCDRSGTLPTSGMGTGKPHRFQTRWGLPGFPLLAKQMLERAMAAQVPIAWMTGDEIYGHNRKFCRWLEAQGQAYALAVAWTEHERSRKNQG